MEIRAEALPALRLDAAMNLEFRSRCCGADGTYAIRSSALRRRTPEDMLAGTWRSRETGEMVLVGAKRPEVLSTESDALRAGQAERNEQ